MKLFHKDGFKHEFFTTATSVTKIIVVSTHSMYLKERCWFRSRGRGARGGGRVLGLIFAGYVPLASQSPYPIIVWACKCNFRDPNLVTFGSKSIDVPPLLLKWIDPFFKVNEEHFTFHLQCRHSGKFANREYEELSYPKNPKMCDPILVALWKMQPHYSQSSRENAIPSSGQPH